MRKGAHSISISRAQLERAFARLASPMKLAWMLELHISHTLQEFFAIGCMTSDDDGNLVGVSSYCCDR